MRFSTTICEGDIGYQGKPIACRLANREELGAYADALKELGKGIIQIRLTQSPGTMTESEYQLLELLVNRSGQPITWSSVRIREDRPDKGLDVLEKVDHLIKRRAIPQVTCRPLMVELNLHEPLLFSSLKCGKQIYNRPVQEQKKVYRDPQFRKTLREQLSANPIHRVAFFGHPDEIEVVECAADPSLVGKSLADIAKRRNQDPFDTLIELPLEDDLQTRYLVPLFASEDTLPILFNDPRTLIGLADGGAHLDQICDAGYCTYLLGKWVRERKAISLEYAVKRLTSEPAALLNLHDRGGLRPSRRGHRDLRFRQGRFTQKGGVSQRPARRPSKTRCACRRDGARDRQAVCRCIRIMNIRALHRDSCCVPDDGPIFKPEHIGRGA